MLKRSRLTAGLLLCAVFFTSACTPQDTGARGLAEKLTASLSSHNLEGVPLLNPEAGASFSSHIAAFEGYPVTVTSGEITYDMNDAVLPLEWAWEIKGNEWHYRTDIALTYSDSQWWATWEPSSFIPGLGAGQRLGLDSVSPARADVLSGDGTVIVTERSIQHYGVDKTRISDEELPSAAHAIAEATSVDPDPFTARVLAAGPKAFVDAISVRPEDKDAWVDPGFRELPGALVVNDTALLPPTRTFARELLGRAGEATAERIEDSAGAINPGDIVGLSGLQKQYDRQLRGSDAVEIFAVNADSCEDPLDCPADDRTVLATLDAGAPTPVQLTLDIDLQIAAEEVLQQVQAPTGGDGDEGPPGSALVAIRPSTGDVLAVANGEGNAGLNHANVGQYPPGSTFTIVTALALLRAGVHADDTVSCPETVNVDGREFTNHGAYPPEQLGDIAFTTAFAQSCATAFIELGDQLTGADLGRAAAALGLENSVTAEDLGYPAFLGSVPEAGDATEFAAALIGQGRTLVSPLALAAVAASVQAGEAITPGLITSQAPTGDSPTAETPDATGSPAPDVDTPLTEAEAKTLRGLMRAAVTEGTATVLRDTPGEPVVAQPGTAEHAAAGLSDPHAWVVGMQDDIAVAVFVAAGVGGAETSGPLLKEFLTRASEPG